MQRPAKFRRSVGYVSHVGSVLESFSEVAVERQERSSQPILILSAPAARLLVSSVFISPQALEVSILQGISVLFTRISLTAAAARGVVHRVEEILGLAVVVLIEGPHESPA